MKRTLFIPCFSCLLWKLETSLAQMITFYQVIIEFLFSTKKGIMATNPCRVQMYTQEIVIFREDIISKMCRNCVYFPEDGDASRHFSRTILSQVCNNPRTSADMEGTLKFVNYKVEGTQNSYSFTDTQYFLWKYFLIHI